MTASLPVALACALVMAVAASASAEPRSVEGTVIHVTDGDTVRLQPDGTDAAPLTLRLHGIDAPERCQAGGATARQALASRVLHRHVRAVVVATDDYQRAIASLRLDGEDVAAWMVLQGHAWSYAYRHVPAPYAQQEAAARAARRGVFADPLAQPPRVFRRQHGPCE